MPYQRLNEPRRLARKMKTGSSSSILTMRDQVVPLRRQVKLFEQIPDADAFRVDGMHDAVVANALRKIMPSRATASMAGVTATGSP